MAGDRAHGIEDALQHPMKHYTHEIVSRLLELHALEERLATFRRTREDTSDVEALIDSLRGNIPVTMLIGHDRLRSRDKRSVAEVHHGVCSGCHLALAVGNVHALKAGSLRCCGNCGRYLYMVEGEDEPASSPPAKTLRKRGNRSTATHGTK
jgi:predicted  nucleic acid-binding Zn-ribbon protein